MESSPLLVTFQSTHRRPYSAKLAKKPKHFVDSLLSLGAEVALTQYETRVGLHVPSTLTRVTGTLLETIYQFSSSAVP